MDAGSWTRIEQATDIAIGESNLQRSLTGKQGGGFVYSTFGVGVYPTLYLAAIDFNFKGSRQRFKLRLRNIAEQIPKPVDEENLALDRLQSDSRLRFGQPYPVLDLRSQTFRLETQAKAGCDGRENITPMKSVAARLFPFLHSDHLVCSFKALGEPRPAAIVGNQKLVLSDMYVKNGPVTAYPRIDNHDMNNLRQGGEVRNNGFQEKRRMAQVLRGDRVAQVQNPVFTREPPERSSQALNEQRCALPITLLG